jgi:ATP-dependent RNA helicase DeaD
VPDERRTHLVSATFPRDVLALANRVQRDPAHIEATPLGAANADIDHLVHLVANHERTAAIVNLLLSTRGAQTLVFVRTRADVADLTRHLAESGFDVRALSGEMEQGERNRALAAFKRGTLHALVATDVAARGIDVHDISRVIHAEPPTDPESYTHRSGRTGRAGRKGTSSVLVSPAALARVTHLLRRAGARFRMAPIPTAEEIRSAQRSTVIEELTREASGDEAEAESRFLALAGELASRGNVTQTIARLLARAPLAAGPEPREVRSLQVKLPPERPSRSKLPPERASRAKVTPERPSRAKIAPERPSRSKLPPDRPSRSKVTPERLSRSKLAPERPPSAARERERAPRDLDIEWVPFRFTWGSEHGADPRRLLAMACRRGNIRSSDIGAIRVGRTHSIVNVAASVATEFAQAAGQPDPRDPRVKIRLERDDGGAEAPKRRKPHFGRE